MPSREPVVRLLALISVIDLLLEQAVLVVDAVTVAGHPEGRQRVQKASGQPAEPAVAQGRVRLTRLDCRPIRSEIAQRFPAGLANSEIEQVVSERLPDQKLDRKIVQALGVLRR